MLSSNLVATDLNIVILCFHVLQLTTETLEVDEGGEVLIDEDHLFAETLIHQRFTFHVGLNNYLYCAGSTDSKIMSWRDCFESRMHQIGLTLLRRFAKRQDRNLNNCRATCYDYQVLLELAPLNLQS